MHNLPETHHSNTSSTFETIEFLLKVGLFLLFGPLTLLGSAYLFVRLKEAKARTEIALFLGCALISAVWLAGGASLYIELLTQAVFHDPIRFILIAWLFSLPLIPLGALAMGPLSWLLERLRPKTLEDWEREEERRIEKRDEQASRHAVSKANSSPADVPGVLLLGPRIKHTALPDHLGIRQVDSWVGLEERILNQHLFILGATGFGKSTTLARLAYEVLRQTERDIFIVDGKGEESFASELRSMIWQTRGINAPIFRLGQSKSGVVYDGFAGDKLSIYNRLAVMIGVQRAEGGAEYYADRNRDFLQLICFAPVGPPRSFEEVRERLTREWLKNTWKGDPREFDVVSSFTKEDYASIQGRIRPLARVFEEVIGPEGFSLETARTAIFSIRAQSASDTAGRFLEFFIEDLKDFAGKRQQRPALLIIDEFGVFGNRNIIDLLRLARGAKLGIVLAAQDVAALGDESTRESLLSSTVTRMLMATDFPEELAKLAGTKKRIEASMQHEEGRATGLGSARLQDVFGIDMNEAARLQPGEAFLFRQRYPVKLRVSPVSIDEQFDLPPELEQERVVGKAGGQEKTTGKQSSKPDEPQGVDFQDFLKNP